MGGSHGIRRVRSVNLLLVAKTTRGGNDDDVIFEFGSWLGDRGYRMQVCVSWHQSVSAHNRVSVMA